MATGGPSASRLAMSEPRNRSAPYRISNPDQEDSRSIGSSRSRQEDRPNNWEFFDWQPSSLFDGSGQRQVKKENQDREKEKGKSAPPQPQRESPSAQSQGEGATLPLRLGSPRQEGERSRQRTPYTYPRTRVTASTPSEQRRALENIRQRMTFSDADEVVALEEERNNERDMPPRKKDRPPNFVPQDTGLNGAAAAAAPTNGGRSRDNINRERQGPDSNQIVGRLMQIRDYIKQASSMMDRMQQSSDPMCIDTRDKLASLVENLKEQERGYLNLLQKVLAAREEELLLRQNSAESANSKPGSDSEATSELDVQSNTSEDTVNEEELEEEELDGAARGSLRPMIEDRLGRHPDTDQEEAGSGRGGAGGGVRPRGGSLPCRLSRERDGLDSTLTAEDAEGEREEEEEEADTAAAAMELLSGKRCLESELQEQTDELDALRQQHTLLTQMLEQQEQLKSLQMRQSSLMALHEEAEAQLAEERVSNNHLHGLSNGAAAVGPRGTARNHGSATTQTSGRLNMAGC